MDAWRGVACLSVLFFHSLGAFSQEALWPALQAVRRVAIHGWLGLHLFFVISGFCIFERLAAARRSGETPAAFIADRARRIFPTYWVVVLLAIVIGLVAMPFNGTTLTTTLPLSLPRWLANAALLAPFTGQEPFLVVAWTLTC
ncbi:MAG TPA: acyltransferase family protein, partial [Opitutaceae bacterium]|nr:acyltransferase family protein [Opitutaceae bacterium]